jgi:hypothetical protein
MIDTSQAPVLRAEISRHMAWHVMMKAGISLYIARCPATGYPQVQPLSGKV